MVRAEAQRRARRYAMATSLLYRQGGAEAWCAAWTLNLSRTGVLFRTEGTMLDRSREVEFIFTLPILGAKPGTQVRCTGRVARVEPAVLAGGGRAVAVTIDHYEFLGRLPN